MLHLCLAYQNIPHEMKNSKTNRNSDNLEYSQVSLSHQLSQIFISHFHLSIVIFKGLVVVMDVIMYYAGLGHSPLSCWEYWWLTTFSWVPLQEALLPSHVVSQLSEWNPRLKEGTKKSRGKTSAILWQVLLQRNQQPLVWVYTIENENA
jgi:hypothetical protein